MGYTVPCLWVYISEYSIVISIHNDFGAVSVSKLILLLNITMAAIN